MYRERISPRPASVLVGCCGSLYVQNREVFPAYARTRKKTIRFSEPCLAGNLVVQRFPSNSSRPAHPLDGAGGRVESANLHTKSSLCFPRNFYISDGGNRGL